MTKSQDHSDLNKETTLLYFTLLSHVVQGEHLLKIDDNIAYELGLAL